MLRYLCFGEQSAPGSPCFLLSWSAHGMECQFHNTLHQEASTPILCSNEFEAAEGTFSCSTPEKKPLSADSDAKKHLEIAGYELPLPSCHFCLHHIQYCVIDCVLERSLADAPKLKLVELWAQGRIQVVHVAEVARLTVTAQLLIHNNGPPALRLLYESTQRTFLIKTEYQVFLHNQHLKIKLYKALIIGGLNGFFFFPKWILCLIH